MAITQITPFTELPDRNDPQAKFSGDVDVFLGEIPQRFSEANQQAGELNALADGVAGNVSAASGSAAAAAQSESNAAASATAAASVAAAWASGGSFTAGETVYSPVTLQTYRARTDHSGLTTDPSTDAANWQLLGADAEAIAEDIKSAVSDAYHFAMIAGA